LRDLQLMDLGLLTTLDALLEQQSVTVAADQLGRSVPAVSRALGKLREAIGDPLLVRAGRGLVATPRALALRPRVSALVAAARSLLAPDAFDPTRLVRHFTLRTSEDLAAMLGLALAKMVRDAAPGVSLHFVPEGDESSDVLRDGRIDLDIGVRGEDWAPEIVTQGLAEIRFAGFARRGHPILSEPMSAEAFAKAGHVGSSRRGIAKGTIDAALAVLGLKRIVTLTVPSYSAALSVAAGSDLIACAPDIVAAGMSPGDGVIAFALPVGTPSAVLAQSWHPRFPGDLAHRWLREIVGVTVKAMVDTARARIDRS
jgi:DNA-binding transcriptional LysR family regulator